MGLWSNLFGSNAPSAAASDVGNSTQIHLLFERALGNDPENNSCDARRKAAMKLVLANETAKGREAWLSISRDFPDELAFALEQVGVCYHLDKDYRAAIENYEAAIRLGSDARRLTETIAEARKGMAAFG
ncbi:hypothetical protein DXH95_07850 [Sphingorhabdus pulchriflava]|uniref:Uncharacterized protein n=1 Tax=Sphingorhabdus pulchriflava TaxID=2292257 RepID=A0A371BID2_9SPHN|nr:hypothetical protein [Sphingorhabdus pulchriflava]RDV07267.1 hypothetical protein DXH95_07850 [Sphingorhabdus pulchriflava]